MAELKIHLQKLERGIIFQILKQEDKIKFYAQKINGIRLSFNSIVRPQINLTNSKDVNRIDVYLRGSNKKYDDDIIVIQFEDNKMRDKVYETLKIGFSELMKWDAMP
jgi:hypothetical protein